MHKIEEFHERKETEKLAASPVETVTKKNRKIMQIHQVLLPNLHQSTHERISSMEKKNIAKYSLNAEFKGWACSIETVLTTAQINKDFVNPLVPSTTEPSKL
ncbi:UNVERIFIED_CONTAM: hypothetical protein NCL1_19496 [Trichonephila clavipes]